MFLLGLFLIPGGVMEKRLLVDVGRVLGASAAMAVASVLPAPFAVNIAASLLAYAGALVALGGVGAREIELVRSTLQKAAASRSKTPDSE